MGDCDSTHRLLDKGMIRAWQRPRMFWTNSIPRGGPPSARYMVLFGSVAECGWDPGTVSSNSEKPGKPSAGGGTQDQNGWPGP